MQSDREKPPRARQVLFHGDVLVARHIDCLDAAKRVPRSYAVVAVRLLPWSGRLTFTRASPGRAGLCSRPESR